MNRILLIFFIVIAFMPEVHAQCSMCRAVVENNADNLGQGLNNGILYLMGFPYIIMIVVGTLLFRYQYRSNKPVA
jgi:hypothetical protein